jgi:hypothetical protein
MIYAFVPFCWLDVTMSHLFIAWAARYNSDLRQAMDKLVIMSEIASLGSTTNMSSVKPETVFSNENWEGKPPCSRLSSVSEVPSPARLVMLDSSRNMVLDLLEEWDEPIHAKTSSEVSRENY